MPPPEADEVRRRIAAALGVDVSRLKPESVLGDLVSDSYRLVEMAIELQDDYDVVFTQADLSEITTVNDLIELVRSGAASG